MDKQRKKGIAETTAGLGTLGVALSGNRMINAYQSKGNVAVDRWASHRKAKIGTPNVRTIRGAGNNAKAKAKAASKANYGKINQINRQANQAKKILRSTSGFKTRAGLIGGGFALAVPATWVGARNTVSKGLPSALRGQTLETLNKVPSKAAVMERAYANVPDSASRPQGIYHMLSEMHQKTPRFAYTLSRVVRNETGKKAAKEIAIGRKTRVVSHGKALRGYEKSKGFVSKAANKHDVDHFMAGALTTAGAYQGGLYSTKKVDRRIEQNIAADPKLKAVLTEHRKATGLPKNAGLGDTRWLKYHRTYPKSIPGWKWKRGLSYAHGGKSQVAITGGLAALGGAATVAAMRKKGQVKKNADAFGVVR